MRAKTQKWRAKVLDACQVVAQAVSVTGGGTAHTVQLMMHDTTARTEILDRALAWAGPGGQCYNSTAEYQRVQAAVDVLRGYEGIPL